MKPEINKANHSVAAQCPTCHATTSFDAHDASVNLGVVNAFRLSVIEPPERQISDRSVCNFQVVRIFVLAILAFALCSCADSYQILGLQIKPAANDDYDGFGHTPGSGDPE
ncbi:MAG: hypothetical protein JO251_14665 [Verrucomicrobia bacterium]|nr:hypothetical protein [Verrucomicrobiota bacterium]